MPSFDKLILLLALVCAACTTTETVGTPTQVLLHVTCDDAALLKRMSAVKISVSSLEAGSWRDAKPATFDVDKFDWPLEVPIFPRKGSDESRQFQVIVQALEADQVLAETRALARFERGKFKRLDRELYACPNDPGRICAAESCRGEACEVCSKAGVCDPIDVFQQLPDDTSAAAPDAGGTDSEDGGDTRGTDASSADASAMDASALDASRVDSSAAEESGSDAGTATSDADAGTAADAASDADTDAALPPCDAGMARCGAGCFNIVQSPMNCGRCGRTCRSGACTQGGCSATSIYSYSPPANPDGGAGAPLSKVSALDQSFVYFQDPPSNNLMRVATAGSTPTLVSYKSPGSFNQMRIDSGFVYVNYWHDPEGEGPIVRMPLSTDNFTSIMGTDSITYVTGMTTNSNQVLVTQTLSSYYVDAIAKTGASGYTRLASGPGIAGEIEADDLFAYFRDSGGIFRSSVTPASTPAAPTVVAAFENGETCRDMVLTSDRLLYASSQRVASVPKAGGAITTLAALSAQSVVIDTEYAYFVHELGNANCSGGIELYRVPLVGGTANRLSVEATFCRTADDCCGGSLMQDASALYWVRGDGLAIRRVEK